MKKTWNVCLAAMLSVLLVAGSAPFHAEAKKPPKGYDEYKQVDVGKDGMVATAHPLASEIGADVLKKAEMPLTRRLPFSLRLMSQNR